MIREEEDGWWLILPRVNLGIVIRGFRDKKTELLFAGENVKEFSGIRKVAERKLTMLDSASDFKDFWHPGEINDRWRICFVWMADGPHEVEITDYH